MNWLVMVIPNLASTESLKQKARWNTVSIYLQHVKINGCGIRKTKRETFFGKI
jgi:hypothetical protein